MPLCLHTACDVEEYVEYLEEAWEDLMNDDDNIIADEDDFPCEYDVKVSGAAMGGSATSINGVALVENN